MYFLGLYASVQALFILACDLFTVSIVAGAQDLLEAAGIHVSSINNFFILFRFLFPSLLLSKSDCLCIFVASTWLSDIIVMVATVLVC